MLTLYTYWRSSASYRVRIALHLKGIDYRQKSIHLVKNSGEQHQPAYLAVNANALVPALELSDGTILTQSMAIIEYLEDLRPEPALLPRSPVERAKVRSAAQLVACDIAPLNNLRVLQHLKSVLHHSQDDAADWMRHWMTIGLKAYAETIERDSPFSFGSTPTLADLCLVPQLYNAKRWGLPMAAFAHLEAINARCLALPAFAAAAPEAQPDAE